MDTISPEAREFVLFCIHRRGKEWPALYDEMCWVAGHRLFRGLGYTELSKMGLSFGLNSIDDTIMIVASITDEKQPSHR